MKQSFKIQEKLVGASSPCFIIGEVGQAHDGSLGSAHAYIDAIARTGADAVKFQTHIANAESSPEEKFRVNCFPQDKTRFDYWKRMEFSKSQWEELAHHSQERGLVFLSSPFSFEAFDLLNDIGVPAWKIGSGEITNIPFLNEIAKTGNPVLLSSGMSFWRELDRAVDVISKYNDNIGVFQCTTSYPCPPEKVGLNLIQQIKRRYNCLTGLSDHSGTIFPSLAAKTLGADIIEVHVVFSKEAFGPDVSSSLTIDELKVVVDGIRFLDKSLNFKIDKDKEAESMSQLRHAFGKSLYFSHNLKKGHLLASTDISLKKPGTGIPAELMENFIGRKLAKSCYEGEQIKEGDFS